MNKKNQLHRLKLSLISVFVLFTMIFAGACLQNNTAAYALQSTTTNSTVSTATAPSETEKAVSTTEDSIPEKNASEIEHFGKAGMQNGFVKFGLAMLGVLLSAIVIFFGLKFYKEFSMKKKSSAAPDSFGQKNSLDSPSDMRDAINLFLDKTDN